MKITVGLDVDDVILNLNRTILKELNNKFQTNYQAEDIHWSFSHIKDQKHRDYAIKHFSIPEFMDEIPLHEGANILVKELIQHQFDVVFVTAAYDDVLTNRKKRLNKLFPEVPSENVILTARKDLVSVDFFVDDSANNIINSNACYKILIDHPWNRKEHLDQNTQDLLQKTDYYRATNNLDALNYIIKMKEKFKC